ncbi:unnamed protein product [Parnassius apollo]|uniref:(apollo) hypothetical protein n=1 Tax=Parnassius apollo TaxID=110799 RepID=A0A8S3XZ33_PARAO|nr:unnamed protein product [Parnassius apollo]
MCYRSLSNPISTSANIHPLANLLKDLASHCQNQFLVSQIEDKMLECNLAVPPFNGKQMQCLIFYDMSSQLCDAVGTSKLLLQGGSISELQNIVKVDSMCNDAQNWKFSNITDFPLYKMTAERVFGGHVHCQKVCDVPDVLSDDSNIYCKYYKWGSDILKIRASTPSEQDESANNEILAAAPDLVTNTNLKSVNPLLANNTAVLLTTKSVKGNSNSEAKDQGTSVVKTTITNIKAANDVDVAKLDKSIQRASISQASGMEENLETNKLSEPSVEETLKLQQSAVVKKPDTSVVAVNENPILDEEEQPPKKEDVEKEDQLSNNQLKEVKDPVIDDIEDEQDSEEEDKQDLQDDSEINFGKPVIQKMEEDRTKDTIKINNIQSQDFISKMPQDEFVEEDDHFFSFFLTAVIIVVLLYILYHNKSKFTKVILGLIVEGRQPGRRRNSRGHAYRRLDTLEQAMNTNATAPPSKIIY